MLCFIQYIAHDTTEMNVSFTYSNYFKVWQYLSWNEWIRFNSIYI